MRNSRVRIAVASVLIVGALCFVMAKGLGSALIYFQTADQAVAHRAQLGTENFNLEGAVVAGSIHRSGETVQFQIESNGVKVPVVNHGSPPQLFQADIPVVLEGHFASAAGERQQSTAVGSEWQRGDLQAGASFYFSSDQIMVKHSAQYVAAHPDRVKPPYQSVPATHVTGGARGSPPPRVGTP